MGYRFGPRERVLAALRHEVPDQIPAHVRNVLDWERHASYFGVQTIEALRERLGNDILSFAPSYLRPVPNPHPPANGIGLPPLWSVPDEAAGTFTDSIVWPLTHAETPADVDAYPWPSGATEDWDFAGMRSRLVSDETHARLSPSWMPVFSKLCELFGMEQAMVNLHWNRPVIEATLAHVDGFYTEFYRGMLDSCGDQLEIFGLGDDFAGNQGLLIQPDLWRALFKPLYAKWLGMAKARGLFTFMHCCGCLVEVLPDLIDIGLDAWQTVQTHLPGQGPEQIKRRFGRHLTFVGAVDTTNVLGVASPDQVREHVRRQILALGEGGGYVCAPDHTIMEGVPSENVAAMYETIARFRETGYTLA